MKVLFLRLCKVPFLIRSHHSHLPCRPPKPLASEQNREFSGERATQFPQKLVETKLDLNDFELFGFVKLQQTVWRNSDLQLKLYFPHPQICKGPLGSAWSKLHYQRWYTSALCICLHTSNYCDCSLVHATTALQQFTQYVFAYVECILPATPRSSMNWTTICLWCLQFMPGLDTVNMQHIQPDIFRGWYVCAVFIALLHCSQAAKTITVKSFKVTL